MTSPTDLRIKIFADGADLPSMLALAGQPHIKGLTTNPTLMRQAGLNDYKAFAADVLAAITDGPINASTALTPGSRHAKSGLNR